MSAGLFIGFIWFVAVVTQGIFNPEERERYKQLEHKRRYGGKRLSAEDMAEWERLAKKYKW